ncbi:unnamed protein product [Cuscuta campestris]|uniref:Uncharacterized protein n=1 Tax=Cuscuta campestris TaxID=132261 RepID=A0A484N4A8_9ASTE|nr:unnamed protein product [Cuscuta campestris]
MPNECWSKLLLHFELIFFFEIEGLCYAFVHGYGSSFSIHTDTNDSVLLLSFKTPTFSANFMYLCPFLLGSLA